jgi:hypothetical protein
MSSTWSVAVSGGPLALPCDHHILLDNNAIGVLMSHAAAIVKS